LIADLAGIGAPPQAFLAIPNQPRDAVLGMNDGFAPEADTGIKSTMKLHFHWIDDTLVR